MRKSILNALALAIIGVGAMMLSAAPVSAGSCDGPAGAQGCTCTGGGYTCTGDSCTSNDKGCTYTDKALVP